MAEAAPEEVKEPEQATAEAPEEAQEPETEAATSDAAPETDTPADSEDDPKAA